MKKIIISTIFISSVFLLANWSKQVSEVAGDKKQRINFYGNIITVANQDKQPAIDNISIENIIKQIPVYVAPTTFTKHINPKTRTLTANPKNILLKVRIDLSEIKEIEPKRVAEEPIIWKYGEIDKETGKLKVKREYLELIVIFNDNTKNNFLVEVAKELFFNIKNESGPQESRLNFKGLVRLLIKGWEDRNLEKRNKLKKIKKGLNHKYPKGRPTK